MPPNDFEFDWDERKNRLNIRKHGLDFVDVAEVFEGPTYFEADTREDYGEDRWQAIGNLNGVVVVVVLCETDFHDLFRVISFRRANAEEREKYKAHVKNRLESGSSDERF